MHKKEVHDQGTFACFVCSTKFKTHKELTQHIQKRCKTQSTSPPINIVHKHNEDINKEDEHKCPKCPKITNNQVSLLNHINTMHMVKVEKCDSCGLEYQSREELIKHIVDNHTHKGTQIIPRHVCKVCNVEVHGDSNRDNHMCRKPQWGCDWCKAEFYSSEARQNHICEKHRFKTVDEQLKARRRGNIECRNGPECWRAALGKCWFKHSQQGEGRTQQVQQQGEWRQHSDQQGQGSQEGQQQGQWLVQGRQGRQGQRQGHGTNSKQDLYCRFQEKCHNAQTCKFKHLNQGFIQRAQNQNQQ